MNDEINLDQVNLDCFENDENYELKKFLIKLIYDLNLKDLFELLKPILKCEYIDRETEMDNSGSRSSSQDSSKSSLSNIDEDINEAIDKLIKNDNVEEKETNVTIKNETIDLINEIVNDYLKLSSVYLIENDRFKWVACLFYICYEKNARFHKMSEMFQLTSQIANKMATSSSQDEANNKYTSNKKTSTSFKRHQSQPFQSVQTIKNKNIYKKPVNLNKLLERTNQSLDSFIRKIRNLTEMLNIPCELVERVDIIEINYNVTCILFNKYKQIYQIIFNDENDDDLLFKFGWLLFVYIKENYVEIGHDLVNSFYLLICCLNLMYESVDSRYIKLNTSLIDYICKNYDAEQLEVKTLNEHYFKKIIVKLKLNEWFRKDKDSLINFHKNLKDYSLILNKSYASILNSLYEINNLVKINETVFLTDEIFIKNITNNSKNESLFTFPDCLKNLPKFSVNLLSFDELKENLIKNKNFSNLTSLDENKFKCFYDESLKKYSDLAKTSLIEKVTLLYFFFKFYYLSFVTKNNQKKEDFY
jgi:hypothetical protein